MRTAFIGTGVMGAPMIKNLLKAGHAVTVYNRSPAKAKTLEKFGAKAVKSIDNAIAEADAIITIVGYPKDVEECYNAIIPKAKKGAILIDMTTSSPSLAKTIAERAAAAGLEALDAPVSGGDIGAKEGTLTIMVGSDKATYEKALPLFSAMGKTINYIGGAGSGQHCKMANQIAIAGNIAGTMEALTYAIRNCLDLDAVLRAISKGSAASFQLDYGSRKITAGDYAPGFFIKHFIKDMRIAQAEAIREGLLLPVLQQVLQEFEFLAARGYGDLGTQALFKYYNEN